MNKTPSYRELPDKIFPYAAVCLMAFFACITLFLRDGWPYNHDGDAVFKSARVFKDLVYRYHDFFPTWSAYGSYSMGSPMPFFYHHLDFYLISLIDLIFNNMLISVKFSVFLLLSLGGTAVYLTVSKLFNNRFYGITSAGLYIFSSYIYTEWLVRGAHSEFAASVIFVWILFVFSRTAFQFSSFNFLILGLLLSLLLYAHTLVFMFVLFSFAIFILANTSEWLKHPLRPAPGLIIPVITGLPYVIPYLTFRNLFNMEKPIMAFPVRDNFIEIYRYFFDNHYNMGETWQAFSVEIGRFYVLPLILIMIIFIIRKRSVLPWKPARDVQPFKKYILFVLSAMIFYIILINKFTLPFYDAVPFIKYIQFPWRLLCLITPLAIILFIYYADSATMLFTRINGEKAVRFGLGLILFIQAVWVGGNYEFYRYKSFSSREIAESMSNENLRSHFNWDEYMPLDFKKKDNASILENSGLSVISSSDPDLFSSIRDFGSVHIMLSPGGKGTIVFNQLSSPFIKLSFTSNIIVSKGASGEAVFSQVDDGSNSFIDIKKRGLFDLDCYCVEKLLRGDQKL